MITVYFILDGPIKNNNMTQLINNLKSNGDLVVWGSSTLSSFSNWVGIRNKTTSYLSEINENVSVKRKVLKK